MTPNKYRKKHKRCGMCRYWQPPCTSDYDCPGQCEVKKADKYNNQGWFCRVYKAEEFKR